MRIGYLIYNLNSDNGWGRYSSEIIYSMKEKGHKVVILKELEDGKEGFVVIKRRLGLIYSIIFAFWSLRKCDVIHAIDLYPQGIIAYLVNIFYKKKFIITAVGTYSIAPLYNKKTSWLSKKAYKSADLIIAISRFTKESLLKNIPLSNVQVVHHGINLEKFYIKNNNQKKYILSVGAIKKRKGYHISIPAFALAKKQLPNLKYIIVGSKHDKGYYESLRKLCREYGVEDDVKFLSNIGEEDLRNLYKNASLFILTSVNYDYHFEGYGLVFLEAAAAGLPTIGTSGNGIEDAVDKDVNGRLVPQKNIEKTAESLVYILSYDNVWNKMSENSYKWAKNHDLNISLNKYDNLYRNIL